MSAPSQPTIVDARSVFERKAFWDSLVMEGRATKDQVREWLRAECDRVEYEVYRGEDS